MHTLPVCFAIFKYCGLWRPGDYLRWTKFLYNLYSLLIVVIMYSFMLFEFIDVFINIKNIDDFTMSSFMLVTLTNGCWRVANILARREKILKVTNMLTIDYCIPGDKQEVEIKKEYDEITRWNTIRYAMLVQMTAALMLIAPLFHDSQERILPFRVWLPYGLSSLEVFWLSYVHQTAAITATVYVNVATDSFISGLMIQVYSQLEILKYRLIKLPRLYNFNYPDEFSRSLAQCILHHEHIFKFANGIESVFNPVIIVQFFASTVALCSSVYQLSKQSADSAEFITFILYLICILFQLFFYCWYGNQVMLKSIEVGDAVYNMDWIELTLIERKNLSIIIQRTRKPMIFKIAFIISLSLDAYMNILKTSYSAFNFLQQSSIE